MKNKNNLIKEVEELTVIFSPSQIQYIKNIIESVYLMATLEETRRTIEMHTKIYE